jgi:DnaJ-class molecular chaperone
MKSEIQDPPSAESDDTAETAANEAEALIKDLAEQKDLHLRLAADFDNFKRRSRQESEARAVAQKESFKRGDLYVEASIQVPPRISKEDELLWQQLATQATYNPRKPGCRGSL